MANKYIWPKCIFFGDSLTQRGYDEEGCFLSLLASRFQRRADIIARGFSGYNTRLCIPVLKILFPNSQALYNTAVFLIFLGANDASVEAQKVAVPEYKKNLYEMIRYLMSINFEKSKIILITPPPVDENNHEPNRLATGEQFTRTLENVQRYVTACHEVAASEGVRCVDLYKAMLAQNNWKSLFVDGLHFSKAGGTVCARVLGAILEEYLPSEQYFPEEKEALCLDLSKPFPLH